MSRPVIAAMLPVAAVVVVGLACVLADVISSIIDKRTGK